MIYLNPETIILCVSWGGGENRFALPEPSLLVSFCNPSSSSPTSTHTAAREFSCRFDQMPLSLLSFSGPCSFQEKGPFLSQNPGFFLHELEPSLIPLTPTRSQAWTLSSSP